jgi:hypothetical protein
MPPARVPRRQPTSFPGYQATTGARTEQAARDVLPGHPLARHIDDFLADLANANRPRNTIRAYRGDLIAFAAHHDGDIAELSATPVRAYLGEVAGQAPATRKRKRAAARRRPVIVIKESHGPRAAVPPPSRPRSRQVRPPGGLTGARAFPPPTASRCFE